jgi:hypothetical protein
MKRTLATALCLLIAPALAQDNPFSGFRGKVREGNWEYRMQMEMPGMPMKMPEQVVNRCVMPQDVDKGGFASKDGKVPDGCTFSNMQFSGDTATWSMNCVKDPKMKVDSNIVFGKDSFTMKQKMEMVQQGQPMTMNQTMLGRYTGPCKK